MPFEIKACTIDEVRRHPTLGGRTQAKVKVMLREVLSRKTFDHNLTLRVWAETNDRMSPHEVNTALLVKAASILKRTVAIAELDADGTGRVPPCSLSG